MSHRIVVPLLALAASLAGLPLRSAIAQQPERYMPDSTPPKRVALRGPVEVPLLPSGIPGADLPVVEVTVNGRGPYRFGIETGANFVALRRAIADSLGLRRAGGPDEFPEYRVDSINVGGASFKEFGAAGMARGATGVDGILGLTFFRDVLLTVDYPRKTARIALDSLPSPDGEGVLAITRDGPFWALPLMIAGTPATAILDTRSTGSFGAVPDFAARLPFEGALQVVGRAGGAAIPEAEVKAGRLAGDIRLGRYTFSHPFISVRPLPPGFPQNPVVGARVLSNFALSLDQRHARLRLARDGSPVIELPVPQRRPPAAPPPAEHPDRRGHPDEADGTDHSTDLSTRESKFILPER